MFDPVNLILEYKLLVSNLKNNCRIFALNWSWHENFRTGFRNVNEAMSNNNI